MNKTDFRKSGLVSAMLVALVCVVFVPAVSAEQDVSQNPVSYFGEGVGSGVQGYKVGSYFYCSWHVGRWQGGCNSIVGSLYFTLYADGSPMSSSTNDNTYDYWYEGPLSSLGASCASLFYDLRAPAYGYFGWSSGLAWLS